VDPFAIGPNASSYEHWGKGSGIDFPAEPNNFEPQEDCGLANYTQSFDSVWGWADGNCKQPFVFMCKMRGTWQRWHLSVAGQPRCGAASERLPSPPGIPLC
jgi:hypothetical protein